MRISKSFNTLHIRGLHIDIYCNFGELDVKIILVLMMYLCQLLCCYSYLFIKYHSHNLQVYKFNILPLQYPERHDTIVSVN